MSKRTDLLNAARRAGEVLRDMNARSRISNGYTRIDPTLIAQMAGVTLMLRPMEKLLGGFIREDDCVGVMVNVTRPRGLVHMTCAHELGHFFMGHDSTIDDRLDHASTASIVELQADQFAYSLLAPDWLVAQHARAKAWSSTSFLDPRVVYQLSLRLGTSYSATVWSLRRIGRIGLTDASRLAAVPPRAIKQSVIAGPDLKDPNGDVWLLDASDRDSVIEPGLNDRFVVELPNNAAAGHLWTVDEMCNEGFRLEPVVLPAVPSASAHEPLVVGRGPASLQYALLPDALSTDDSRGAAIRSTAHSRPRRHVALQELRPWEPISANTTRLEFDAEFEQLEGGLSPANRVARIEEMRQAA
jgi:hypothetical protein